MKVNQIPRRRLGTALSLAASLAALCLAALFMAPAAALAASPPPQPTAPTAISTTTTTTTLEWGTTGNDAQVTGYDLQELENGTWTTIDTVVPVYAGEQIVSQELFGLSPATTYQFAVIAFDAAGDHSARSNPGTVTTLTPTQFPECQFHVTTYSPGFTVVVTLTNTTVTPLTNWSVSFAMPASTTLGATFGGVLTPTATGGTLTAASYDATIAPGIEAYVGFEGSVSPFNPPSGFALNGHTCTSN